MPDGNVVKLFVSDDDLDAAWVRFDAAMLAMHTMYQTGEADENARRAAAQAALDAENDFRALYARSAGKRTGA